MSEAKAKTILIDYLSNSSLRPISRSELAGYRWYVWSARAHLDQATSANRITRSPALLLDDLYRAVVNGTIGEQNGPPRLTRLPLAAMSIYPISVARYGWDEAQVRAVWAVPPNEAFRFLCAFRSEQMLAWRDQRQASFTMPQLAEGTAEMRTMASTLIHTEWRLAVRLVKTYPTDHSVQAQKQGSFLRFLHLRSMLSPQRA